MTMQTDLAALREELAVKRLALQGLFDTADKTTDPAKRDTLLEGIKTANTELAAIVDKIEPLQDAVIAAERNAEELKRMRGAPGPRQTNPGSDLEGPGDDEEDILDVGAKSVKELLREGLKTNGLKTVREGGRGYYGFRGEIGELAVKTLITSTAMTPLEDRQSRIVPYAVEERTVADLMLQGTTGAQVVSYFVETAFTNNAAPTDEGALKPESALAFTLRQDAVRKIATWIPVTDEALEDIPGFESMIRDRMGFMVKAVEENQLLNGDGTGLNILGLYNRNGVQTVTGYGISTIDSILRGIVQVQTVAFVEPTAMVLHPLDWFDIRTSKDSTNNYLLGPATQDPNTTRPWGLNIRVTTRARQNTALVGAFNMAQVFRRSGIAIAISTENQDFFITNKLAVRAEERLALAVYRPEAFCKVEAIVVGS